MLQPSQDIYHIVHIDRLASIYADGCLWSDASMAERAADGTSIGIDQIKRRRREELTLSSHPGLYVGQCVPFYFCPRSVMLYMLHRSNHESLPYRGGQQPIVHLVADLNRSVRWAEARGLRWAFTLKNAGARDFEDRASLEQLQELDWVAVNARDWRRCKEGKQAEFLVEQHFPWDLIEFIGVYSEREASLTRSVLTRSAHKPIVEVRRDWYY